MTIELITRIVIAALLGGIIGFEREFRAKEAGFRTHSLVALGSALFMLISQFGFADVLTHDHVSLDPSRVAAQVVSGRASVLSVPVRLSFRSRWCAV